MSVQSSGNINDRNSKNKKITPFLIVIHFPKWLNFLFGTLRKHFRYWESDDLHTVIAQAIHYFNHERPVRKLNGKPPVLFRTELVA